jgi:hypothetical protein
MATLRYIESGNVSADGQQAVNQENLRQALQSFVNRKETFTLGQPIKGLTTFEQTQRMVAASLEVLTSACPIMLSK